MKSYKEFTITANPFNADLISSILWELDIAGINEEENYLKVFTDYKKKVTTEEVIHQLKKLQAENLLDNFTVTETEFGEKNWNEEWEKSINILHVSDRIVVKPSFKDYKKKDKELVITIDPKMSFGTGEHATTKLIVQLLEKYIMPGMKILDAGTGTGILAITSVLLGASEVIGFDIDEWCYENASENCLVNNVSDKIEIRKGEINVVPESNFDMALANIQKNILMDLAQDFRKRLKSGGLLLLSGLLSEDKEDIIKKYSETGFTTVDTKQMDEWTAIVLASN
jgi:ribosomal protein L11 methyltransferase